MKLSKEDQIHGILTEGMVRWFSKWFKDPSKFDRKPSDYLDITIDEVFAHVKKNGFDQSTVAYEPLEARYLIEKVEDQWCASFHERGKRQGLRYFSCKEDAERHVIKKLIDSAKNLIDKQFWNGGG